MFTRLQRRSAAAVSSVLLGGALLTPRFSNTQPLVKTFIKYIIDLFLLS